MNWSAGILLWLVVLFSTLLLLLEAGDVSVLAFCIPASLLAVAGAASLGWFEGVKRMATGMVSFYSGLIWLVVTSLMFLSPDKITSAPRSAWPGVRLGAMFQPVRAVGLLSILGMILFLSVVYLLGFFAVDTERGRPGRGRPVAAD